MWALLNDAEDAIEELIQHPKTMTIDGIKHPRQMFKWATSELKAVGIVPVTTSGSHLNTAYYTERNEAFAIANDKASVVRTIGEKAADKSLVDVNAVDEDGEAVLDDHDNQIVSLGLKSQAKLKADRSAHGMIKGFGWLVQRKVTADTAIPSDVTTYMAAVRTAHASICTAIDNAGDMDAFIVLHTNEYNDDGSLKTVQKINDWPDDYEVEGYRR